MGRSVDEHPDGAQGGPCDAGCFETGKRGERKDAWNPGGIGATSSGHHGAPWKQHVLKPRRYFFLRGAAGLALRKPCCKVDTASLPEALRPGLSEYRAAFIGAGVMLPDGGGFHKPPGQHPCDDGVAGG
jgi:hypothetical protein